MMKPLPGLLMLIFLAPLSVSCGHLVETDVCIYGGGAGGVTAAVEAARQGKKVALLVFNNHVGGISSSGLGATDVGESGDAFIQGLARDFYTRIGAKYGEAKAKWVFEPHVAEAVFNEMLKQPGVTVYLGQRLAKTTMAGQKISAISMEEGNVFRAKVFIDASYEGDLLKQAGVSYTVGREANSQYGETINGIRMTTGRQQLPDKIDPYIKPGDPASGLLPGINPAPLGPNGTADSRIQAYCYRMCLTGDPSNRVPVDKPPAYKESDYELLFRTIEAGQTAKFFKTTSMPNRKTDSNNDSGMSCDYIGANYDYPEADYVTRAKIAKDHENWQCGLIWTLQNHPRVPQAIRDAHAKFGLPADEFKDNHHWPYELYVREARRMVSDYVMTEKDCQGGVVAPDSVGLAAYTMDSHNCQRIVHKGFVKNEGNVQKRVTKPFPVSYRALVPKATECSNLLTPWSVSATHIAFSSVRMEPVYMILGQSAGAAACIAIDNGCTVQKVPYDKLKSHLLKEGQALLIGAPSTPIPTQSQPKEPRSPSPPDSQPQGMNAKTTVCQFVQKLQAGAPQCIVGFGTSLTAGGPDSWLTSFKAGLTKAYPGLVTVINSGGGGKTSKWGVANVQMKVIDKKPDVVFIEFATNDSCARFKMSQEESRANLETIVDRIKTALPQCEIVLQIMNPVIDRPEGHAGWRPFLTRYQQMYRDLAQERGFKLIDHTPAWQAVLDKGPDAYHVFVPDGLHPNNLGYKTLVTPHILKAIGVN